jgi:hypothetical protein
MLDTARLDTASLDILAAMVFAARVAGHALELSVMEQRYHAVMEVHARSAGQRGGPSLRGVPAGVRHAHHGRMHKDKCGRRPCRRRAFYQSAWTTVPLCRVTTVALAIHAGISEDISGQFIDSCQCLAIPAGDS